MLTRLFTLPDGDAQTVTTFGFMRDLAYHGALDPSVRQVAAFVVQGSGRDALSFATNLAGWVAMHTRFLPDPSVAEALVPPDEALALVARDGLAYFDCDDVAILTAALGLSVGLRARFVAVGFLTPDAPFAHVWAELGDEAGTFWLPVDPPRPAGGLPPIYRDPLILEV